MVTNVFFVTNCVVGRTFARPTSLGCTTVTYFTISCLIINFRVVERTIRKVVRGGFFGRGFLVTVTSVNTFTVNRCTRNYTIILLCAVNRFLRSLTINGDHGSVASVVRSTPRGIRVRGNNGLISISPRRIGPNSVFAIGPNRGVRLSNVIRDNDTRISATTLANRDVPTSISTNSRICSNSIGTSNLLEVGTAGTCDSSAITEVLSVVRSTSDGGDRTRGFVAEFTECCAPTIYLITLLVVLIPPVFFNNR